MPLHRVFAPGIIRPAGGAGVPQCASGLATDLDLYWQLDSDVSDASGNGNTGTATGSPSFVSGKLNNAVDLNGSTQYITCDTTFFDPSAGAFSIAAWVNADVVGSLGNEKVIAHQFDGSGTGRTLLSSNAQSATKLATFIGGSELAGSTTLTTGTWYHVCVTVSASGSRNLYLNGSLNAGPSTDAPEAATGALLVGRHKTDLTRNWNGRVDDFRVYSRELSASEVSDLYNAGAGCVSTIAPPVGAEEVSSSAADHIPSENPWNDTVAIPSGSNRILLDFLAFSGTLAAAGNDRLDPTGANTALTLNTTVPVQSGNQLASYYLLEASMPSAANYALRYTSDAAEDGFRQIVTLRNARQAISYGQNSTGTASASAISATATRNGGGSFPAGTRVYGVLMDGDGGDTYTVTGDATEVRDLGGTSAGDRFVFASGVLTGSAASVSVTFTPSGTVNRKVCVVVAVEPV